MNLKKIQEIWKKTFEKEFENNDFFKSYFLLIEIFKIENNSVFFLCPNFIVKKLCENEFKLKIKNKFLDNYNLNFECYFLLKNENIKIHNISHKNDFLDQNLNFESYVIGDFNEQILKLKKNILSNFSDFCPIFIYGSTGLGKTHAINAFGNYIKQKFPEKKILFMNTEDFLNKAYNAISRNNVEKLKESFYNLDVLIFDDIQFFSKKNNLNKIFFSIFNKLHNDLKMIILASDKKPDSLDIDSRMISRFQSGITINIKKPDENSLKKIIELYEKKYFFSLSKEASDFLTNRFNNDIRLLIGIIKKIALNFKSEETITRKKIEEILSDEINLGLINSGYRVSPEIIIQNVADYYQINFNDIVSKSRKKDVKNARAICIYILRKELNISYTEIGSFFSKRSHSTIMSAFKMLESEIKNNSELSDFINKIIKKI